MRRVYLKFAVIAAFLLSVFSQTCYAETPKNWGVYNIPGACSFSIPNMLELRDVNSKFGQFVKGMDYVFELKCEDCNVFSIKANYVFQPKGLNEVELTSVMNSLVLYARIMIAFTTQNQFTEKDIFSISDQDLQDIGDSWKKECIEDLKCITDYKFDENQFVWFPLDKQIIGGKPCMVSEYLRPGFDGQVRVKEYKFFLDGKFIRFTLSYRNAEASKYASDFENFKNSIQFENPIANQVSVKDVNKSVTSFISEEDGYSFSYSNNFEKQQISPTSPHVKLKIVDKKIQSNYVTIGVWNDIDYSFPLWNEELIKNLKEMEKKTSNNPKNIYSEKVTLILGKDVQALKSTIYRTGSFPLVQISYRIFNRGKMITFNVFMEINYYNNNKQYPDRVLQGLILL